MLPHVLLQMTDLHIAPPGKTLSGGVDTAACLQRALEGIARLPVVPEAVLITGDMVDDGSPESYRHLRSLLAALPMPIYMLPGNHDDRDALGQVFADYAPGGSRRMPGGYVQYTAEVGDMRLVVLDTAVSREHHGALDAARLDWLECTLADAPGRKTLVALHHPPVETGIAHMDAIRMLEGADAFEAIVARHPQVQLVACGHLHRLCIRRFAAHSTLVVALSVAHQIALELRPQGLAAFTLEPPGCLLHVWSDTLPLVSHLMPLSDFAGPFAFDA